MKLSEIKNISNWEEKTRNIKIKSYLPILLKDAMINGANTENVKIDGLINACINKKDNMFYVDYVQLEVSKFFTIVNFYTDLDISGEDIYEVYDYCVESEIYSHIINRINEDEYKFLCELIDKYVSQEIKIKNSLEGIVASGISQFIEKIPTESSMKELVDKIPEVFKSLSPQNKKIMKGVIDGKLK